MPSQGAVFWAALLRRRAARLCGVRCFTYADVRAGQVEGAAPAGGKAGSAANAITLAHRMTLDEAKLILNVKNDISAAAMKKEGGVTEAIRSELGENYERLFKINAPPAPKGKEGGGSGSFYIQSKIVRARERIEEEWKLLEKAAEETAKP